MFLNFSFTTIGNDTRTCNVKFLDTSHLSIVLSHVCYILKYCHLPTKMMSSVSEENLMSSVIALITIQIIAPDRPNQTFRVSGSSKGNFPFCIIVLQNTSGQTQEALQVTNLWECSPPPIVVLFTTKESHAEQLFEIKAWRQNKN